MVIVVKLRNKQIGIYALMIIALIGFILIGKHSFKKEEVKEDKVTHKFNILTDDNVFKKAWGFQVALYKKAVSRFIYRKEISKHGLVKYRFLTIPFIIYRKRNYTK